MGFWLTSIVADACFLDGDGIFSMEDPVLNADKEIASINQQSAGRKKESHVQMRAYAEIFAPLMGEDLPKVSKAACAANLQTNLLRSVARIVLQQNFAPRSSVPATPKNR